MAIRCLPYPSGESLYSHNSFSLITMNVLVLAIASVAIGAVNDLSEMARTLCEISNASSRLWLSYYPKGWNLSSKANKFPMHISLHKSGTVTVGLCDMSLLIQKPASKIQLVPNLYCHLVYTHHHSLLHGEPRMYTIIIIHKWME